MQGRKEKVPSTKDLNPRQKGGAMSPLQVGQSPHPRVEGFLLAGPDQQWLLQPDNHFLLIFLQKMQRRSENIYMKPHMYVTTRIAVNRSIHYRLSWIMLVRNIRALNHSNVWYVLKISLQWVNYINIIITSTSTYGNWERRSI